MIDEKELRDGLKRLLKQTEDDIRDRLKDEPELLDELKAQHAAAVEAGRADSKGFRDFRDDAVTQAAVHWLLGCVFVRFLEDNELIDEAWIAGPGARLEDALDRRRLFYRENPRANDRDYLLHVFEQVAALPDMADLFDREHNPLWRLGPTGPQAMKILQFFQQRDEASGELQHDFTDPEWGTRFLGDLYQNLSDYARKRYALCQTPDFVIDFILDRTLTPALDVFGLEETRLIDPTCGSGHFLLAAFDRLYRLWQKREPTESPQALAQKVLDAVCGVDLNPFAVEIARFRLLVAALKACGVKKLRNAPDFRCQLAAGDSLLHGPQLRGEGGIQRHLEDDPVEHFFQTEDAATLRRMLGQQYHCVIGNPPYISVKDRALRAAYRSRYQSCEGKYQLSAPFFERFFSLARHTPNAGFVGMLNSNAFMRREFGKTLIEKLMRRWELSHVIDTSRAFIPDHGTPTVIVVGRSRPAGKMPVRTVMGIRGEAKRPKKPALAPVWQSICRQVDQPDSESQWVSVADLDQDFFHSHPWAITGGGVSELKTRLDEASGKLGEVADSIGIVCFTLQDDAFLMSQSDSRRHRIPRRLTRPMVLGDAIGNWIDRTGDTITVFPYDDAFGPIAQEEANRHLRLLWPAKTVLANGILFGQKTKRDSGLAWYEFGRLTSSKLETSVAIAFSQISTHNQFVYETSERVFNRSAPIIKLRAELTQKERLGILGMLNSSVSCFWLKQVCHNKGGGGIGGGLATEPWEQFYDINATPLKVLPLPGSLPSQLPEEIQRQADRLTELLPESQIENGVPRRHAIHSLRVEASGTAAQMIALQEELDWQAYHLYGLLEEDLSLSPHEVPGIKFGERPFEFLMARQIEAGDLETTWFERHGSKPITQIPSHWPEKYRAAVQKRLEIIESNREIALIEQPEHKRRWNLPTWEELEKKALEKWLLDRMESVALWSEPVLKTCARLGDALRRDADFVQVAEFYAGRPDFDFTQLVTDLALDQAVPFLPVLRYKPSGLEKRRAWEEVWDLQRREDAGEEVEIPVPPKYRSSDFLPGPYWRLRGGLDVPKERFILYPHLERDSDSTPVLAWAGWDHLQQARALAAYYHHVKEEEGWTTERLKPVLAGLLELIPWLKQWHNDVDEATGDRLGDVFEAFLETERQELSLTEESLREWAPPQRTRSRRRRRS